MGNQVTLEILTEAELGVAIELITTMTNLIDGEDHYEDWL
jgi:hypothetical protein